MIPPSLSAVSYTHLDVYKRQNVTSFFRDTDTHKYLKEKLFPKLLKRKKPGETLRIWVPACATGEEAYSIAMILLEIQGSQGSTIPVQIFATDLSENAISKARIGAYTKQELETCLLYTSRCV